MELNEAIRVARAECPNEYAQQYLATVPEAIEEASGNNTSAVESLKIQLRYAMCNMLHWRGDKAREVKKIIRNYLEEK
jgi:hypothetical protein